MADDSRGRRVILGGGVSAPYPSPTSEAASRVARGNTRRDTRPELALRSALHRGGLRFRKQLVVDTGALRPRVDVVFTRARVAVFVDGCFWHGCPDHGVRPAQNQGYWGPKLAANARRDRRTDAALDAAGWVVVRVWEHEDPAEAAAHVARVVRTRRR